LGSGSLVDGKILRKPRFRAGSDRSCAGKTLISRAPECKFPRRPNREIKPKNREIKIDDQGIKSAEHGRARQVRKGRLRRPARVRSAAADASLRPPPLPSRSGSLPISSFERRRLVHRRDRTVLPGARTRLGRHAGRHGCREHHHSAAKRHRVRLSGASEIRACPTGAAPGGEKRIKRLRIACRRASSVERTRGRVGKQPG
jgi:hypothetical protein